MRFQNLKHVINTQKRFSSIFYLSLEEVKKVQACEVFKRESQNQESEDDIIIEDSTGAKANPRSTSVNDVEHEDDDLNLNETQKKHQGARNEQEDGDENDFFCGGWGAPVAEEDNDSNPPQAMELNPEAKEGKPKKENAAKEPIQGGPSRN